MALQKGELTTFGFTAANAYHRICDVRGDPKAPSGLRVCVASYYDASARGNDDEPYTRRWFTLIPETVSMGTNILADLYAKLKAASTQNGGFFNSGTTDV